MKRLTLFLILITVPGIMALAQTRKINILHADDTYVDPKYPGATISQGNVFIEHDGATLRYYEMQAGDGPVQASLHSKVWIIGEDVIVGSANADVRST